MGHFAELLVFNDLTPFFVSRESPTPSRPYETASRPAAKFWKTVTNICRFVKEKVDCLASRPSLDGAFAAGGEPPKRDDGTERRARVGRILRSVRPPIGRSDSRNRPSCRTSYQFKLWSDHGTLRIVFDPNWKVLGWKSQLLKMRFALFGSGRPRPEADVQASASECQWPLFGPLR